MKITTRINQDVTIEIDPLELISDSSEWWSIYDKWQVLSKILNTIDLRELPNKEVAIKYLKRKIEELEK